MRLATYAVFFATLVTLSVLASATHACWTPVGVGEGTAKDVSVTSSGVYIVSQLGSNALIKSCTAAGGCTDLLTISNFEPHALTWFTNGGYLAGKKTTGTCPGGQPAPCATVENIATSPPGPRVASELDLSAPGLSPSQIAALNFYRFVQSGGVTFLVATGNNFPIFYDQGDCPAGYCGERTSNIGAPTSIYARSGVLLIGTSSGKIINTVGLGESGPINSPPVIAGASILGIGSDNNRLYLTASTGKAFFSNLDLDKISWTEISSNILPAGGVSGAYYNGDMVVVPNLHSSAVGLYFVNGRNGETYAFTNTSTVRETYLGPTGFTNIRFVSSGSNYWAYSLATNTVYKFNCAASPSLVSSQPPETIPYGGDWFGDPNIIQGNSLDDLRYSWGLTAPVGVAPSQVFQTLGVRVDRSSLDGRNATRAGSYTWKFNLWYNGFPAFNTSVNTSLTVNTLAGGAPTGSPPAGDLCAGVTCAAGQTCNASSGACINQPAGGGAMCTSNAQCPLGSVCSSGVCVNPPSGLECSVDGDCPSGEICGAGNTCIAGSAPAAPSSPSPSPSQAPSSSPSGPVLSSGGGGFGVVPTGGSCRESSECSDDEACQEGRCTTLTCAEGRLPISHRCVTICSVNSDCGNEEACIDGVCRVLTCPDNRPMVIDHACAGAGDSVVCEGVTRNRNLGVCCANRWVEGETSCVGGETGSQSGLDAVRQAFAPQGNLLPFVAIALLVVLLAMGAAVYFLVIRKPPGDESDAAKVDSKPPKPPKPPASPAKLSAKPVEKPAVSPDTLKVPDNLPSEPVALPE